MAMTGGTTGRAFHSDTQKIGSVKSLLAPGAKEPDSSDEDDGSSSGSGSEGERGEGDASPTRGSTGAFFDRDKVVATSRRLNATQNTKLANQCEK
eukprot:4559681-Alexandrium_andersonii.AAC.1